MIEATANLDHFTSGYPFFRLTVPGLMQNESFEFDAEEKLIKALDIQPDEEVVITFVKRKKTK